jgi:recombination protein RecA
MARRKAQTRANPDSTKTDSSTASVVDESAADFAPELPAKRPGAKAFADIAAGTSSFRPARQVLRRVRSVPTIFPGLDHKLRVGGWPIDRVAFVHGPSMAGKTTFVQGLGLSFLRRGHMYAFMDAEHTTPAPWLEILLGQYVDDPRFVASRPESYEQAVDDVRKTALGLKAAREAGKVPPDTTCLFVVDSLGKLVPLDIQEKIRKHAAESKDGSVDGYRGASGMIKAALNKAWLDQLIPLMASTGCAIVFVVRESQDRDATARDRMFGNDWKTTGGSSLLYEASIEIRVSESKVVREDPDDWKSAAVGERHTVEIRKTKVSAREDVVEKCSFATSNGLWTPEGFDRARDLLDLGEDLGVVERGGSWVSFGGRKFQGERRFLQGADPELLDALEAACRAASAADVAKRADVL